MPLSKEETTITDLHDLAPMKGVVRAGATADVAARRSAYEREGYHGTMYFAPTQNMELAENRLLSKFGFRHNQHGKSNAAAAPGFVYVIQGSKR